MSGSALTLQALIDRLWIASPNVEWQPKISRVPLSDVKEWMTSDDLEVLGFIDSLIHEHRIQIEPALPLADYVEWVKHYYGRCFHENPDGEWSDSSYSAGWTLVSIFVSLWDDDKVNRKYVLELKNWLAKTYKSADERLRTCIVNATLEHLFERKQIGKYFSDWKSDPVLAAAYVQACLWEVKTPLSKRSD